MDRSAVPRRRASPRPALRARRRLGLLQHRYMLLRLVLQKTTGKSFSGCVNDLIVGPLDLRDTFVAERVSDWSSCVPGYGAEVDQDGEQVDVRHVYHPGWCAPGVAVSTAAETTQI